MFVSTESYTQSAVLELFTEVLKGWIHYASRALGSTWHIQRVASSVTQAALQNENRLWLTNVNFRSATCTNADVGCAWPAQRTKFNLEVRVVALHHVSPVATHCAVSLAAEL